MGGAGSVRGLRRVFIGGLLGASFTGGACGGRAHSDAGPSVTSDGGLSGSTGVAGMPTAGASGGGPSAGMQASGASGAMDAGSCDDEEQAAQAAFAQVLLANGDCNTDADCTRAKAGADCVALCGVHVNAAGVSAVQAAAVQLCRRFDSRSCVPPSMSCPPPGVVGCHAGKCAEI